MPQPLNEVLQKRPSTAHRSSEGHKEKEPETDAKALPAEENDTDKPGKVVPAKPKFARENETRMKTQLTKAFKIPPAELRTTSELKLLEKKRRDEAEELAKAKRRVVKAKVKEDFKNEQIKQYKHEVAHKLIPKVRKAPAPLSTLGHQQSEEEEETVEEDHEEEEEAVKEEEKASEGKGETEPDERPTKERPADWYTHAYKEGEDEVDVGTEVVPITDNPKPKMFNVGIQVGPKRKSITRRSVLEKPEVQDTSVGVEVDVVEFAEFTKKQKEEAARLRRMKEGGPAYQEEEEGGEWEGEGQGADWDAELERDPEFQKLSPEEKARVRAEKKLGHKLGLRADAMTLARPAFYRELDLRATLDDALVQSKETQVTEHDIEHTNAQDRGLALDSSNILWPTSKEFHIELGEMKLEDYVRRCWKLDKEWMYHIRLIQTHTTDFRKKYIYEVIFSIPTQAVPVPPATASVFFVIEVLKYGNVEEAVKVTYVLEGTRYPHTPGHVPFQQKWLQAIVADKLSIQRKIDF